MAKRLLIALGVVTVLALGITAAVGAQSSTLVDDQTWSIQAAEAPKCSFNSDCKYGKCGSGKCGYCDFNSDCNGYGVCSDHQCGRCSFSSDCGSFGPCSSGRCEKSPW